ncbi:MAG: ATP synthase F1 subunit delta [Candidatus Cloacimonadia bacterium]
MIRNIIADRYSQAFVDLYEDDVLPGIEKKIEKLIDLWDNNPLINEFLSAPLVRDEDKKEVIDELRKALDLSEYMHKFLYLLVDNDRMGFLRDICEMIKRKIHNRLGINDVTLLTTHKVQPETLQKIKTFLHKYIPDEIHFNHRIDESIRGGFIAYGENIVIDASVKNNLELFKKIFVSSRM